MSEIWTVYGLVDPRDGAVFYVGMSTNVQARVKTHCVDSSSAAYWICKVILGNNLQVQSCIFGSYLDKVAAKILEGRLILALPSLVNKKSFHGLPSSTLYPNWQDLRTEH